MEIDSKIALGVGGLGVLYPMMGLPTVALSTVALPLGIGVVAAASLYGAYRIITKDERLYNRKIEEEREKFNILFEGAGIRNRMNEIPKLVNIWEGDYETIYSFIRPNGFSTVDLNNRSMTIKEYFDTDHIEFESNKEFINIKVTTVELPNFVPFIMPKPSKKDVVVNLGIDRKGNKVRLNLNKCPNVLIAGQTGSGKSICTNVITTQLYCNYPNVEMYLIDMKSVELNVYRNLKQTKKYVNNLDGAREVIYELLQECDRRNKLFNELGVKKLEDYNKKVKEEDKLNPIVCIIEEAVRLMADKELNKVLAELGFICRSVSVSIIANIQRPTAKLFSPDLKASLTNIIGFKTVNKKNSEVITDTTLLSNLKGKGHGILFNEDVDQQEFQGYFLDENDIEPLLKRYCRYK